MRGRQGPSSHRTPVADLSCDGRIDDVREERELKGIPGEFHLYAVARPAVP